MRKKHDRSYQHISPMFVLLVNVQSRVQDVFECRSSARQRRGRAGRVAPGSLVVFFRWEEDVTHWSMIFL